MVEWWNAMGVFEQVLAGVGVVSALALVIQTISALLGAVGGASGDFDADMDIDIPDIDADFPSDSDVLPHEVANAPLAGLRLFTTQGIVAFFAIFSWSALLLLKSGLNMIIGLALAMYLGFTAMAGMAAIMRSMMRLQYDGTADIKNALGTVGTVYLTVPAGRDHPGKVTIMVQGRLMELDAVTDEVEAIPTGSQVFVSGISGKNMLLVTKKD